MREKIHLASETQCTGCMACRNVCSNGAIVSGGGTLGFLRPEVTEACIGCHRCEMVCPVLHPPQAGVAPQVAFAVQASDEIRCVSSSGGVFTLLAQETLAAGGVVYGAAAGAEDCTRVALVRVTGEAGLAQLRGSKYVQADPGLIYREAERDLEAGREVLFSGTPCQIAALKNVLGRRYERLLLVGVVCHGVSSQRILGAYRDAHFPEAAELRFRDKACGWQCTELVAVMRDGTRQRVPQYQSAYEQAFHASASLAFCCYDCPFAELPRQEDVTLGDFWGIERWKRELRDDLGTSLVMVNSERGRRALDQVRARLARFEEVPLSYALVNRFYRHIPVPFGRWRLPRLFGKVSVDEALGQAVAPHYDVGLVGIAVPNYGSNLTYYALYSVLTDQLDKDVLMIAQPGVDAYPEDARMLFAESPFPRDALAMDVRSRADLFRFNACCGAFVLGSDQIWHAGLYHAFGEFADLRWVADDHLKIAYATSFGREVFSGTREDVRQMVDGLRRFDAISVREESGVGILRQTFGLAGTWVLDPVFLCSRARYEEMANRAGHPAWRSRPYIFSYMLDITPEKEVLLHRGERALGCALHVVTDAARPQAFEAERWSSLPLALDASVEEWLAGVRDSEAMVTDSFHGTCFAIIFHRPFLCILNDGRGAERFRSLLSLLGLEERLARSAEEAGEKMALLREPVDWERVDEVLRRERARSFAWLSEALALPHGMGVSGYDRLAPSVVAHDEHSGYIDGWTYFDVLPAQAPSGKRTRLAIGDRNVFLQVFERQMNLESHVSLLSQGEIYDLQRVVGELRAALDQRDEALHQEIGQLSGTVARYEQWRQRVKSHPIGRFLVWVAKKFFRNH